MREILFRGKRKNNGEWVEGHLIQSSYMGEVRSWISTPEDKTRLRAIATYYGDWRAVEVGTNTICQYTGLTDKNGNKIWENDIVKDDRGNIYKAFWQERYYQFSWICVKSDLLPIGAKWDLWSLSRNGDLEVIGNTFDSADLLKGE